MSTHLDLELSDDFEQSLSFDLIASALDRDGYWIGEKLLPLPVLEELKAELSRRQVHDFKKAAIGRGLEQVLDPSIRRDKILWIDNKLDGLQSWLAWTSDLQSHLNRRLFLGLFSFESHFALYEPGDFYAMHYDAFRGQSNRVLSLVIYLNEDWPEDAGGELVLYDENEIAIQKVRPEAGTVALFLSEETPHEVLAVKQERYSVAGWFRLNSSLAHQVDPPR